MKFDNSNFLGRAYLSVRNKPKGSHFAFECNNQKVVYSYIRKNASSAFKRLMADQCGFRSTSRGNEDLMAFLSRNCRANYRTDIRKADRTIFVYRDPYERLASLYINKFVQQSGCHDIFASYEAITNKDPLTATFNDFVFDYLDPDFQKLDPHVLPQRSCLLPIVYTDAIPLSELRESVRSLFGAEIADRHFGRKVNASSERPAAADKEFQDSPDTPASEMNKSYADSGFLPAKEALLASPVIRSRIEELYRNDMVFCN